MSYNKILAGMISYSLLAYALCGCGTSDSGDSDDTETAAIIDSIAYLDAADMFSDRDKEVGYDEDSAVAVTLADDASSCSDSSVTIEDNTVTITEEGTYLLSGSLSNGQVVVDAEEQKVQLVLDGVSVNCDTSAAFYVKSADKVFVTLADGSQNTLSNTAEFVAIDDNNIDAVLFSKEDLTLNGGGTLTVNAAYGHGIVSKDDLVITSGTYNVTAEQHALSGKDSVRIASGTLTLDAGTDGIHSENADDDEKGFVYIGDGTLSITCASDGIDAEETLQMDGGTVTVEAGDDGLHADGDLIITAGTIDVTKSYEGLEGMTVTIEDGTITLVATDDGINAAGDGSSGSADTEDAQEAVGGQSSDDFDPNDLPEDFDTENMPEDFNPGDGNGQASSDSSDTNGTDGMQTPPGTSDGTAPQMPENTDSTEMQEMPQMPENANSTEMQEMPQMPENADSTEMQEMPAGGGGGFGGDGGMFDEATDYNLIQIMGGTLTIDAEGDGLDSNGDLTVSGGEISISGPTNGGNGAIDCAGTATITGGTLTGVCASGMAQNFDDGSTQGCMLVTVSTDMADGELTLTDAGGNTLVSYTPTKSYNSVVISCADLAEGETYTLTAGGVSTEVTLETLVYGEDDDMGGQW